MNGQQLLTSGLALEKSIMGVGVTIVELVTFLGIVALASLVLGEGEIVSCSIPHIHALLGLI